MQERYEIRGKIGQGGLGAVYRAYDLNLKREVAIKRILTGEDSKQTEEAARQMEQETGALAALQHPNIVTIYDVGTDDDGPFVVMELLKGDTIDAIVEKAPLTDRDFREFARQVQEALVAAQDLGLVHRDLKPSNVMVNWLPSGKFQIKIVDFGLAKFSPKPSQQTLNHDDAVYGSIMYMAPEQFERAHLDSRTDMYAIGCVYYFALAGVCPFQGDTGPQVMAAHLDHRVTPLHQMRPDMPKWVCDWVMWHINRQPSDRPENARESLASFMELEDPANQPPQTQTGPVVETPKRSRLIIPGAPVEPDPVPPQAVEIPPPPMTQTAPQPMAPPSDSPPSLHTTSIHQTAADNPEPAPNAPEPAPVTQPSSTIQTAQPVATQQAPAPVATSAAPPSRGSFSSPKRGMSTGAKAGIAAMLAVVVVVLGMFLVGQLKSSKVNKRYNELVRIAAFPNTTELDVSKADLDILLSATRAGANKERETVYKALAVANATDGTPVSVQIAKFAVDEPLPDEVRVDLLSRVVARRADPSTIPVLLGYLRGKPTDKVAAAALTALGPVAGKDQFEPLLDIVATTPSGALRKSAEDAMAAMLGRLPNPSGLDGRIAAAMRRAENPDARHTMIRLIGLTGGKTAAARLKEILDGDNELDQLAALGSLQDWPDESMFEPLMEFLRQQTEPRLRDKAFDAAYAFVSDDRDRPDEVESALWTALAKEAKIERERTKVITGLARSHHTPWSLAIVKDYAENGDNDRVIDLAEKASRHISDRLKLHEGQ